MEVFLIKALQLMLSFSILVLLHEEWRSSICSLTLGSISLSSNQRIRTLHTVWDGCLSEDIVRFRV